MSRPKEAEPRTGITIYMSKADLDLIDLVRHEAEAAIPGARLSRSGWAKQVVVDRVQEIRQERQASEGIKKKR